MFLCWAIPRLQHPEVNSRRPGRFEVRLRERARKKRLILYKIFLLSLVQVCWPLDAKPSASFCSFLPLPLSFTHTSPVSLRRRFYLSHAKVAIKKRSICGAENDKDWFLFSRTAKKSFSYASVLTIDIWIYGSGSCRAFSKRHGDCCRKCQAFFSLSPPRAGLFKPANQSKQSFVRLMQICLIQPRRQSV